MRLMTRCSLIRKHDVPRHRTNYNESNVNKFRTLIDALNAAPGERPFVTAWIDEDEREEVTFAEFRRRARLQAALLREPSE